MPKFFMSSPTRSYLKPRPPFESICNRVPNQQQMVSNTKFATYSYLWTFYYCIQYTSTSFLFNLHVDDLWLFFKKLLFLDACDFCRKWNISIMWLHIWLLLKKVFKKYNYVTKGYQDYYFVFKFNFLHIFINI